MKYIATIDVNSGSVLKWEKIDDLNVHTNYILFEKEWKKLNQWSDYEVKELFDDNIPST